MREYLKSTVQFVLDLSLTIELARRDPINATVEYNGLEFIFSECGTAFVRHNDNEVGQIQIDPDEIKIDLTAEGKFWPTKSTNYRCESDRPLGSKLTISILEDFLDLISYDDDPVKVKLGKTKQKPKLLEPMVTSGFLLTQKWLRCRYTGLDGIDITYEDWLRKDLELGPLADKLLTGATFCPSDMDIIKISGSMGYMPAPSEEFYRTMAKELYDLNQFNEQELTIYASYLKPVDEE